MKLRKRKASDESDLLDDDLMDDGYDEPISNEKDEPPLYEERGFDDLDSPNDGMDDNFGDLDSDGGMDFGGDGGPVPLEKHNDLLKELTNFDSYIRDTFNNWLGIAWSEEEQKFVKNPLLKPIMNVNGAAWCVSFLKTYARKNNIITDISRDEYVNLIGDVVESVWLNLGTREDLGVYEEGDLIRVCVEMEHVSQLVLMGAGGGRYNKLLSTTYSFSGNASEQMKGDFGQPEQQPKVNKGGGVAGKLKKLFVG